MASLPSCRSGRHVWLSADAARKCCNGWKRVLVIGGDLSRCDNLAPAPLPGGVLYGYAWERMTESELLEMEASR